MDLLKQTFDSCARGAELANVSAVSQALLNLVRAHPQHGAFVKRLGTAGLEPASFLRYDDFLRLSAWLFDDPGVSATTQLAAVYSEASAAGAPLSSPSPFIARQRPHLPHSTPCRPPAALQGGGGDSGSPAPPGGCDGRAPSCFRSARELHVAKERASRLQHVRKNVYGRLYCAQQREAERATPTGSELFDCDGVDAGRCAAVQQIGALLRNDSEVLKRQLRQERLLEVEAAAAKRIARKRLPGGGATEASTQHGQMPELLMGGVGGSYQTQYARRQQQRT